MKVREETHRLAKSDLTLLVLSDVMNKRWLVLYNPFLNSAHPLCFATSKDYKWLAIEITSACFSLFFKAVVLNHGSSTQ